MIYSMDQKQPYSRTDPNSRHCCFKFALGLGPQGCLLEFYKKSRYAKSKTQHPDFEFLYGLEQKRANLLFLPSLCPTQCLF